MRLTKIDYGNINYIHMIIKEHDKGNGITFEKIKSKLRYNKNKISDEKLEYYLRVMHEWEIERLLCVKSIYWSRKADKSPKIFITKPFLLSVGYESGEGSVYGKRLVKIGDKTRYSYMKQVY